MSRFLYTRIVNGFLVTIGVIIVVFFLFNVLPADPARMMLGQRADSASLAIINRDLGLNKPLAVRFGMYMNDLSLISIHNNKDPKSSFYLDPSKYEHHLELFPVDGNKTVVLKTPYLRRSYQNKKNVSEILSEKIPDTAVLALAAIIFASFFGIIFGVIAAVRKNSWVDRTTMAISIVGVSLPSFFVSIVFAWIFGFVLSRYTGLNMTGGLFTIDPFEGEYVDLKNLILPTIVLGIRPMSIIFQLTRSSMLDVLSQDYIRTAKAKGVRSYDVVMKHSLKNALNPVITAISGWLGSLLAGAVFIEYIFGWNGIGKLTVTALENYDLPVIMGIVLFISVVFIILNILADFLYGVFDPRVRVT